MNSNRRRSITCARGTSIFGRNITTCSARYNFTVSEFLAGIVDINAVVRQYCRNTETKDQARLYQFMRDLIACRDWYDRDSGCILAHNMNMIKYERQHKQLLQQISCQYTHHILYYAGHLINHQYKLRTATVIQYHLVILRNE